MQQKGKAPCFENVSRSCRNIIPLISIRGCFETGLFPRKAKLETELESGVETSPRRASGRARLWQFAGHRAPPSLASASAPITARDTASSPPTHQWAALAVTVIEAMTRAGCDGSATTTERNGL
jgi:hypothetical protein